LSGPGVPAAVFETDPGKPYLLYVYFSLQEGIREPERTAEGKTKTSCICASGIRAAI
jgi:hypothetical protein